MRNSDFMSKERGLAESRLSRRRGDSISVGEFQYSALVVRTIENPLQVILILTEDYEYRHTSEIV